MNKKRVVLMVLVVVVVTAGAAGAGAAAWSCSRGHVCPVVMHGVDGEPARLHVRCWDEDGRGEVDLTRVGGNDWFLRCE